MRGRALLAPAVGLALVAFYCVLGLLILDPDAVYSGDIGVKFVQARALASHHFTSLAIRYPGEVIDAERLFFPIRPPFVMSTGGEVQAIFPPAAALIQAAAVSATGIVGLVLISIVSSAVVLWAAARIADPRDRTALLVLLGLGSPLWFFAVSGWEHAAAIACSSAAFAVAIAGDSIADACAAGALLGIGATQRDEVILLMPGMLLVLWLLRRSWRPLMVAAAATMLVLFAAAAVDVWWFHRPAAAHLRHAVHLLQSALRVTSEPNPDLPELAPFTARQRYETVVQYWLLGYGRDPWIGGFIGALIAALAIRWRTAFSAGLLLWLAAVLGLALLDFREVATAPKWLAGMQRVSPFLACALLPAPRGVARGPLHRALLLTALAYVLLAYAGVDTTGGKSLGPRLLLPLFPLLSVPAVAAIREYSTAVNRVDRAIGGVGMTLAAVAVGIHTFGTIPAYVGRNRDDASAIEAVRASPERVVVVDDVFTAQLMFPLYYRKIIMLADEPGRASDLAGRLVRQRIGSVLLVSRQDTPAVQLSPLTRAAVERKGRMTIERWQR